MKTASRLAVAMALALLFSLSVLADGDMHTTITDPPPPANSTTQTTQANEAVSQPGTGTTTPSNPVTEAILATLPTLLAVL